MPKIPTAIYMPSVYLYAHMLTDTCIPRHYMYYLHTCIHLYAYILPTCVHVHYAFVHMPTCIHVTTLHTYIAHPYMCTHPHAWAYKTVSWLLRLPVWKRMVTYIYMCNIHVQVITYPHIRLYTHISIYILPAPWAKLDMLTCLHVYIHHYMPTCAHPIWCLVSNILSHIPHHPIYVTLLWTLWTLKKEWKASHSCLIQE
jgi:hypothetical protein